MPTISDAEWARMKNAVEELTALNQIASAINVSMSVEKITQITVDHCLRRVKAEQGAVYLLSDKDKTDEQEQFKTFVREMKPSQESLPFHVNMALSGWMIKNKSILLSNNPDEHDGLKAVNFAKLGIRSILAVPLLSKGGLMGLMAVFNKSDADGFTDTDKRFLGILGVQTAKIIENARLMEKELQLKAIEKEVNVAKDIQRGFLPKDLVKTSYGEFFGFNDAARGVGGDLYDIQTLDDHRIFFSLGDVSGKGIPAALLMSNAQAVVRSQLTELGTASLLTAVVHGLNKLIFEFTEPGRYLTAVFCIYDSKTRTLEYINAGHLNPYRVKPDGTIEEQLHGDIPVGVMPEFPFTVRTLTVEPNDLIVLYTDGVTECMNTKDELYDIPRFLEFLGKQYMNPPTVIADGIRAELAAFRGTAEQSDDITVLIGKFA